MIARLTIALFLILGTGCGGSLLGINVFVVDQKTALERQVLGSYEAIGADLASFASVRGVNPDGTMKPERKMTDNQRAVLMAMNNRRYNRDDLDTLLAAGVVGETRNGLLERRNAETPVPPNVDPRVADAVIAEENADRRIIVDRLVETTPGVKPGQRGEVEFIFARLNQDLAPVGSPIQDASGAWSRK